MQICIIRLLGIIAPILMTLTSKLSDNDDIGNVLKELASTTTRIWEIFHNIAGSSAVVQECHLVLKGIIELGLPHYFEFSKISNICLSVLSNKSNIISLLAIVDAINVLISYNSNLVCEVRDYQLISLIIWHNVLIALTILIIRMDSISLSSNY